MDTLLNLLLLNGFTIGIALVMLVTSCNPLHFISSIILIILQILIFIKIYKDFFNY